MKNIKRLLIFGLIFIMLLAVIVFTSLVRYMDRESESDVRKVATTYISGIAATELSNYEAIAAIRQNQIVYLKNQLDALGSNASAEAVTDNIRNAAKFQDLKSCVLVSSSGKLVTIYGNELITVGNIEYL